MDIQLLQNHFILKLCKKKSKTWYVEMYMQNCINRKEIGYKLLRIAFLGIPQCFGVRSGLSRPSLSSTAPLLLPKHGPGACAPAFALACTPVVSRPTGRARTHTLTGSLPYQCTTKIICVSSCVSLDLVSRPVF